MSQPRIPQETRQLVRQRAGGCCEYCRVPEWVGFQDHHVEHIVPRRHGGTSGAANLALACGPCNWAKGTDLTAFDPVSRRVTRLFHPRQQTWSDHFAFAGLRIQPLSRTGRATARHLEFNRPDRIALRRAQIRCGPLDTNLPPL